MRTGGSGAPMSPGAAIGTAHFAMSCSIGWWRGSRARRGTRRPSVPLPHSWIEAADSLHRGLEGPLGRRRHLGQIDPGLEVHRLLIGHLDEGPPRCRALTPLPVQLALEHLDLPVWIEPPGRVEPPPELRGLSRARGRARGEDRTGPVEVSRL